MFFMLFPRVIPFSRRPSPEPNAERDQRREQCQNRSSHSYFRFSIQRELLQIFVPSVPSVLFVPSLPRSTLHAHTLHPPPLPAHAPRPSPPPGGFTNGSL